MSLSSIDAERRARAAIALGDGENCLLFIREELQEVLRLLGYRAAGCRRTYAHFVVCLVVAMSMGSVAQCSAAVSRDVNHGCLCTCVGFIGFLGLKAGFSHLMATS